MYKKKDKLSLEAISKRHNRGIRRQDKKTYSLEMDLYTSQK